MKQRKALSILLMLCMLAVVLSAPASAADVPPSVQSDTVYMADPYSGYVYFDKNGTQRVYPASLTKIMTALLIVEAVEQGELSLTDTVTALPGYDWDMTEGGSSAGIAEGETMTLQDLLYCTMLVSANEAANIMAMHHSGNIAAFVERMNARAAELGCADTHFVNPHGLPHDDHYTTAYDMFLIAREAMSHRLFATVCGTELYIVPATNQNGPRTLVNTNGLITQQGKYGEAYYYAPAVGIKTGHTNQAGYCLISQAVKKQISPICIVMGGDPVKLTKTVTGSTAFADSVSLYQWVFSNFTRVKLMDAHTVVAEIPVLGSSDGSTVGLRPHEEITGVLPDGSDLTALDTQYTLYEQELTAPVWEGQVLGEVSLSMDGVTYGTAQLIAERSMERSATAVLSTRITAALSAPVPLLLILVLTVPAVLYASLLIRRHIRTRKQQRELENARMQRQRLLEQEERERLMRSAKRRAHSRQQLTPHSAATDSNEKGPML